MHFEHYVFTTKGPQSEENALLKLWKAITRYKKTVLTEQRDLLAVAIHKTFIFEKSKLSITIPAELLEVLDVDIPYDRPSTPALKTLQQIAEEELKCVLEEYLNTKTECGGSRVTEEKKHSKKVSSTILCLQHYFNPP
jgi:hypothetical protein